MTLTVTFVTVGELYKWAERRSWGARTRENLEAWLHTVVIIPPDRDVTRTWGLVAARADARGRPRPTNDTWVAACCIAKDLQLLTFNLRDFEDFEEHDGLRLLRSTLNACGRERSAVAPRHGSDDPPVTEALNRSFRRRDLLPSSAARSHHPRSKVVLKA